MAGRIIGRCWRAWVLSFPADSGLIMGDMEGSSLSDFRTGGDYTAVRRLALLLLQAGSVQKSGVGPNSPQRSRSAQTFFKAFLRDLCALRGEILW